MEIQGLSILFIGLKIIFLIKTFTRDNIICSEYVTNARSREQIVRYSYTQKEMLYATTKLSILFPVLVSQSP